MRLFTLKGTSSELSHAVYPPIEVKEDLLIGLLDLNVYNSIPNIDYYNNKFYYSLDGKFVTIPTGSYEIEKIENFLQEKLGANAISLKAHDPTLKCCLKSTLPIDFSKPGTIGPLLGFSKKILTPNIEHFSDLPVQITAIHSIFVDCNLVSGSFLNGAENHTIHEFSPAVKPGFRIIEKPRTVVYLPVNSRRIDRISIKVTDQNGNLINFRHETLTVRLHLKYGRSF